ncbi:hypothetical protein GZL_04997 [Streptomyces sp. 769]|nr:hypothetical protein GZL_04997 [Streptomyces sp. 769]
MLRSGRGHGLGHGRGLGHGIFSRKSISGYPLWISGCRPALGRCSLWGP